MSATVQAASKEISLAALQKRNMEINKYLVQNPRPHRLSLSRAGSTADSQMDDTSVAPTPRDASPAATPRTLSLSGTQNMGLDSLTVSEASNSDMSYQRSPRGGSGKPRGGFGYSDRPLLGGEPEDLARSRSFSGQEVGQKPSNLSIASQRDVPEEESTRDMRRLGKVPFACC